MEAAQQREAHRLLLQRAVPYGEKVLADGHEQAEQNEADAENIPGRKILPNSMEFIQVLEGEDREKNQ